VSIRLPHFRSRKPLRSEDAPPRRQRRLGLLALVLLALPLSVASETFVWVDGAGVTHLTDDPSSVPESERGDADVHVDRLGALWNDGLTGPMPATPKGSTSSLDDRILRMLAGAIEDYGRGEGARATAALRSATRLTPARPEPYWYLAQIDRQRGRYASAAHHLRRFILLAGPELEAWRVRAKKRLALLSDENRLADETAERGPLRLVALESPHFRVQLDSELSEVSSDYAKRAIGYLDDARREVSRRVGIAPLEPLGVVFYGRAAYSRAHQHRFSFQTVGFFDGRIHVSSPAHPSGELRSLLYHEYTHAVFRDRTGGDRPYWFNEGLAEQIERSARHHPASTRTERASLRARIVAGEWIPLRVLAPSFSGLSNSDARAAYLQSVVAVQWIDGQTTRDQRAQILSRIGEGRSADQALYEVLGLDTAGLDTAVQKQVLSEFPDIEGQGISPAADADR
jgi:hypothetical protein